MITRRDPNIVGSHLAVLRPSASDPEADIQTGTVERQNAQIVRDRAARRG